jgi:hypothetical protein
LRDIIPSSIKEKIKEEIQVDEEIVEKIVSDSEVFSSDDLVEIVESSKNDDSQLDIENDKPAVGEKDIWNIDSIVKKKSAKPKKGVIRFAEDIDDLKK